MAWVWAPVWTDPWVCKERYSAPTHLYSVIEEYTLSITRCNPPPKKREEKEKDGRKERKKGWMEGRKEAWKKEGKKAWKEGREKGKSMEGSRISWYKSFIDGGILSGSLGLSVLVFPEWALGTRRKHSHPSAGTLTGWEETPLCRTSASGPSTSPNTDLSTSPKKLLNWQCIALLQVASWFLSHSGSPLLAFWGHLIKVDSYYLSLGNTSTSKNGQRLKDFACFLCVQLSHPPQFFSLLFIFFWGDSWPYSKVLDINPEHCQELPQNKQPIKKWNIHTMGYY